MNWGITILKNIPTSSCRSLSVLGSCLSNHGLLVGSAWWILRQKELIFVQSAFCMSHNNSSFSANIYHSTNFIDKHQRWCSKHPFIMYASYDSVGKHTLSIPGIETMVLPIVLPKAIKWRHQFLILIREVDECQLQYAPGFIWWKRLTVKSTDRQFNKLTDRWTDGYTDRYIMEGFCIIDVAATYPRRNANVGTCRLKSGRYLSVFKKEFPMRETPDLSPNFGPMS